MLQGKQVDESKLGGANGLSFVLPLAAVITSEELLTLVRKELTLLHQMIPRGRGAGDVVLERLRG